jgi:hypothetical protein
MRMGRLTLYGFEQKVAWPGIVYAKVSRNLGATSVCKIIEG